MLTTSRGSFSAARSSASAGATGAGADSGTGRSDESAGTGTGTHTGTGGWRHFVGANGQILGNGRWQFSLAPAPASVEWVDFDGALLYEGRSPGFTWDGSSELILSPPGASLASDAELHVRVTTESQDSTEAPEAVQ